MHSMTSLHILFVQTFIKYQRHVNTTLFSPRRVPSASNIYMDTALQIL